MLMLDLGNPQSVMYRMLFTTSLRDKALPAMLHTVMQVFQSEGEELPAFTPYLALAAVTLTVQTLSAGGHTPAGALELAAAGGLGQSHLERLAALSVMEVLPLSMKEWCLTYVPKAQHSQQWLAELNKAAEQWQGLVLPCPRAD